MLFASLLSLLLLAPDTGNDGGSTSGNGTVGDRQQSHSAKGDAADGDRGRGDSDDSDDSEEFVPKSKFESVIKSRDATHRKVRALTDQLAELQEQLKKREEKDNESAGDYQKIKESWTTERQKLQKENAELQQKLRQAVVEKDVRSIAQQYAISADQVWGLIGHRFDVAEDDEGRMIPVVKDSVMSPEEFIQDFLEKNPNLAKNTRKGGSGTQMQGKQESQKSDIPADLFSWPQAEQSKWMAQNPALAKEALAKALGMR
jgi:hypothetical protein